MNDKNLKTFNVIKETLVKFDPIEFGDEEVKDRLNKIASLITEELLKEDLI